MGSRREDGTGGPDPQYGGVPLLASAEAGPYPAANSLLVSGTEGTVLVDPSIEVGRRGGLPADVGLVALTHAHEDHAAGLHVFPEVPVVAHPAGSPPSATPRPWPTCRGHRRSLWPPGRARRVRRSSGTST